MPEPTNPTHECWYRDRYEAQDRDRKPRWVVHGNGVAPQHQPAWEDWLRRHGLPPLGDIPANSEIIYDSATGALSCWRNMRTDAGGLVIAGNAVAVERVTVVPPPPLAPFPPGLTVTVD